MNKELNDKELLEHFLQASTKDWAFGQIVKKYQRPLYALIRRIVFRHEDVDDVIQNTFVKVWENLDRFRSDAKLYTWIYRIATNESLAFLNKQRHQDHISLDQLTQESEWELPAASYFNGQQAERSLEAAIQQLPDKQRLVFQLKYFENLSYFEISEICGTSEGALKASYFHAVQKIEKYLQRSLNLATFNKSNE